MATPAGEPRTPAPTEARATVPVVGGAHATINASSGERPPQVIAYLPPGELALPAGAREVTLVIEPRSPGERGLRTSKEFTTVAGGTIIGNVYRISATTPDGAASQPRPGRLPEIRLRAPFQVRPSPRIARFDGARWRPLATHEFSGDVYGAKLSGLGDYALVVPGRPPPGRNGGSPPLLLVLAPVLALGGLALVLGRRR